MICLLHGVIHVLIDLLDDNMENWDDAQLADVVNKKHAEGDKQKTAIVSIWQACSLYIVAFVRMSPSASGISC